MQAQYKNLFSDEGLNELQNRFKGKGGASNDESKFQVHVEEPSIGGKNQLKESELNFYGDNVEFEYRRIIDLAQKRLTYDSRFAASADVRIAEILL